MLEVRENIKNVKEFNLMTEKVGWGTRDENIVKEALDNTLYTVSIYDNNEVIAYGRIIGDKTIFVYIHDVMVDPRYQGKKIGTMIMNKLMEQINEYKNVNPYLRAYLGASKNKEGFYAKFGFISRDEAGLGKGMILPIIDEDE